MNDRLQSLSVPIFLKFYYLTVLAVVSQMFYEYFGSGLTDGRFTGIFAVLNPIFAPVALDSLILFFIAATLAAAFFFKSRAVRVIHALAFLLAMSVFFSFGKTNFHSYHTFIYLSLGLAVLDIVPSALNRRLFPYLLAVIFFNYTATGIWKLLQVLDSESFFRLGADLKDVFRYKFAYARAEGTLRLNPLQSWFIKAPFLGAVAWLAVIALETLSGVCAFSAKWRRVWTPALMVFHCGIGITMGIGFVPAVFGLGFLMVIETLLIPEDDEASVVREG